MNMFVTVDTKEIKGLDITEEVKKGGLIDHGSVRAWLDAVYPDWESWTLVHTRGPKGWDYV